MRLCRLLSARSRTHLPGMPNGGQTGDPCVRLTFPRTGLAVEGSVGQQSSSTPRQASMWGQHELRRGTETLSPDVRILDDLNSFHCPLTMEMMRDPVMTADGQTYERREIASWFALGNRTSPLTGAELPSTNLTPNTALRKAIIVDRSEADNCVRRIVCCCVERHSRRGFGFTSTV